MNIEHGELLSAFADGETVDPDRLAEALTDPEAAAVLVNCARVRAELRNGVTQPRLPFVERMGAVLRPRGLRRFLPRGRPTPSWQLVTGMAASSLVVGLWAGLWVGSGPAPPIPPSITVLAPSTVVPAPEVVVVPAPRVSPSPVPVQPHVGPPRPTRVLRFGSPGEWRDGL